MGAVLLLCSSTRFIGNIYTKLKLARIIYRKHSDVKNKMKNISHFLNYFNILGNTTINYLKLFSVLISVLIGGIYIGSKASKKGWLEGIKIGLEVIILLFLILSAFSAIYTSPLDIRKVQI